MLDRVVLVIISRLWRTSVRVGVGRGFGEVCGMTEVEIGCEGLGIKEGVGSSLWSVGEPRVGDRWPGVVSLKTTSLEK